MSTLSRFHHSGTMYNTFIAAVFNGKNGNRKVRNILYNYKNDEKGERAEDMVNNESLPFAYASNSDINFVMIATIYNLDGVIEKLQRDGMEVTNENIINAFMAIKPSPNLLSDAPNNFKQKEIKYTDSETEIKTL